MNLGSEKQSLSSPVVLNTIRAAGGHGLEFNTIVPGSMALVSRAMNHQHWMQRSGSMISMYGHNRVQYCHDAGPRCHQPASPCPLPEVPS